MGKSVVLDKDKVAYDGYSFNVVYDNKELMDKFNNLKSSINNNDDDSVLVKIKPITYEHEVVVYVPVFQKNFDYKGNPLFSPTFTYSYQDANRDDQMCASLNPDYILKLTGYFKATTKPFIVGD